MRTESMFLILFTALPVSVLSQPVTIELKATVDFISNQIRDGSIYIGPAVSNSSLPFQLGDEMRFILTYDPTATAILRETSTPPPCLWDFEGAQASATLIGDRYSNSWPQIPIFAISCDPSPSSTLDITGDDSTANVNEAIEGIPFQGASIRIALSPACLGFPPVLRTTDLTFESDCQPISDYSTRLDSIRLAWRTPSGTIRSFVEFSASQDFSVAIPSNAASTPAESDVVLNPVVVLPDGMFTVAQISFQTVATSGTTTVTASTEPAEGAAPPSGFKLGDPAVYFDVSTTASYSGDVEPCFYWQQGQFLDEATASLLHYEDGVWQDVTISRDVVANKICGLVATLSPFAIVERSFAFDGFFPPVDNRPVLNIAKAGSSIPVNFDLNGNQGTEIFPSGYPGSQSIACDTNSPSDVISETVAAGNSGLSYDAASDLYTYVWKTDKTWAQSCRRLLLKFRDGSIHSADFRFQR